MENHLSDLQRMCPHPIYLTPIPVPVRRRLWSLLKVEEQEVQEIVDSRLRRDKLEYLIHWKGFLREEHEWKKASEPTLNRR